VTYWCGDHGPYPDQAHHCPQCVREAVILIQQAIGMRCGSAPERELLARAIVLLGHNPALDQRAVRDANQEAG
jgi:hypothetical protein